ncbi:uncharacterized protein LOC112188256 isoform X3 [Rosa chinensis]|uniref:uncharacterized protein LOC112188256 isoform X3 n=1 Tax=Rosa chinensis TaxID=74649 RepID=UPI001AD94505|nr:uncharacterized protein LOC112188256 isoform X3 [Rosa chinensis]
MYLRIASGLLVPEAKLFLHSEDLLYVDKAKPHDRRTMCDSPIVQTKLSNHLQVKDLTEQFPAATPLALALKQFLADCSLDQSYSGGLSSYCLEFGDLLMNFLYFFGNVFDPRQMRISVQGSGVHIKRERGCRRWVQCVQQGGFSPLGFLVMLLLKLEKCLSIFIIFFCSQEVESWKVDFRSI